MVAMVLSSRDADMRCHLFESLGGLNHNSGRNVYYLQVGINVTVIVTCLQGFYGRTTVARIAG